MDKHWPKRSVGSMLPSAREREQRGLLAKRTKPSDVCCRGIMFTFPEAPAPCHGYPPCHYAIHRDATQNYGMEALLAKRSRTNSSGEEPAQ
jgi:hypothetical protein